MARNVWTEQLRFFHKPFKKQEPTEERKKYIPSDFLPAGWQHCQQLSLIIYVFFVNSKDAIRPPFNAKIAAKKQEKKKEMKR